MIGDRVNERLGSLSLSQAELARRTGIHQTTINQLVNGKSQSSAHLHRIARELRTTVEYLEGRTDDPTESFAGDYLTEQERDWVDVLRDLEPANRELLLSLGQSLLRAGQSRMLHEKPTEYRASLEEG